MARSVAAHLLLLTSVTCAAPAFAKDQSRNPQPRFELQPIIASSLLAPAEPLIIARTPRLSLINAESAGLVEPPPYRLEREGDSVTGKRAKLSVAVGDTRLFAVSGKLSRRERPGPDRLDAGRSDPFGSRKLESGRLYGGGVERAAGPIDLSATYQFSRINGANLDPNLSASALNIDSKHKSQSIQLKARLRF